MSKQKPEKQNVDLSSLDFGPAWARGKSSDKKEFSYKEESRGARGSKGKGPRRSGSGDRPRGGDFKGKPRGGAKGFNRGKAPQKFVQAEEGIEASIMPVEEGVDNLAKEITASGRTYSVFELARVVLGARERFKITFSQKKDAEKESLMFQCKPDGAVFMTKDECLTHAASAEWLETLYKSEEIEVEPPSGNFQNIAKCGFSGELLGPTNFHAYQERVAELHRTKFSNMSLDFYKKRIVTESGDDVVNLWKEGMKKRKIYKLVADESVVFDSLPAVLQHISGEGFDEVFHKTPKAQVPSDIDARKLSPSLLTNLKEIIQDQRRYPGSLSSFLCRQLSGRQLAVYKWQGKLHCGPSRPHQIPEDLVMADRPSQIHDWVKQNAGSGVDELWKDVCPADLDEKQKFEWYHDLHWLINEGYVVFMNTGMLFPSSASKKPAKKQAAKKAESKKQKASDGESKKQDQAGLKSKPTVEGKVEPTVEASPKPTSSNEKSKVAEPEQKQASGGAEEASLKE